MCTPTNHNRRSLRIKIPKTTTMSTVMITSPLTRRSACGRSSCIAQDTKNPARGEKQEPNKKQRRNVDSFSLKRYATTLQSDEALQLDLTGHDPMHRCCPAGSQLHTAPTGLDPEIKRDRRGLVRGLGLFSFTRLDCCFLEADRLHSFSLSFLWEFTCQWFRWMVNCGQS